jgi:DNA replication and repair protein RecF
LRQAPDTGFRPQVGARQLLKPEARIRPTSDDVNRSEPTTHTLLAKLRVLEFRNLRQLEFSPGPRFNVVFGDNGQGKSNLLEAIEYVGSLRSFRGARVEDIVNESASRAELAALAAGDGPPHALRVTLDRAQRREVRLDDKRPRSRSVYGRILPAVVFHPGELSLTAGGADARRGFLDHLLTRLDETYATSLAAYTRALASRNRLLRAESPNRRGITAYDELLAASGAVLGQARAALVDALSPRVATLFREISDDGPALALAYEPRVKPEVASLRAALQNAFDKDIARGFTADGPHADDLVFRLRETKARRYASQGQHRAMVLALKVAELLELEKRSGRTPLLLLDDVSSELDRAKNRRFFAVLARLGGQVFLTTTQPDLILVDTDRRDFLITGGQLVAS